MTTKEQRELLALVFQAQMRLDKYIPETAGSSNPQVMAERHMAQARLDVLQAVADALRGSQILLRVVAGL